ncbi:nitrogen assimilation transcriptional regulator, partial [Escherichia coli]|nr:nitrogen assimilation transcriptional regulator [Escherichia coli]
GAVSGWMSRITTPSMSLSLSLNLPARANLSPQAQAVKELLMSVISSPVMEKRQWQLVS